MWRAKVLWEGKKRIAFLTAIGVAVSLLILGSLAAWAVAFHMMWAAFERPSDRLASAAPHGLVVEAPTVDSSL